MTWRLLRLAVVGAVAAVLIEWWLEARGGRRPPAVIVAVVVQRPIDRVWEVIADVESQPRWMTDLESVRLLTPPPVGVGTRAVGAVRILGLRASDPVEITAFEPPSRFAIRHDGRFRGYGEIILTPLGPEATSVRWSETLITPVVPRLAGIVQRPIFRAVFQADLENLCRLLED